VVKRIPQDLHATSQRTRLLMSETLGVVDELLEQLGLDYSDPTGLDVRLLVHRQPGLIRRALMGWWIRHSPQNQLGSAATDTIIGHVQSGRADQPVSVGPYPAGGDHLHVCVLTRTGRLEIRPESLAEPVAWTSGCHWNWRAGPLYLPDGSLMEAEPVRWPAGEEPFLRADPRREAWLVGVDGPLFVRQWRSGDKYRPLGAPGRRKLQDLFTDAKLGAEQKNTLPVILDSEGEILWVPGFPPAERARVGPADNTALRLTYREHLTAFPPEHVG
jgi:tRNA(Ile)-lysidine synthase